jgi:hypothetical protein
MIVDLFKEFYYIAYGVTVIDLFKEFLLYRKKLFGLGNMQYVVVIDLFKRFYHIILFCRI